MKNVLYILLLCLFPKFGLAQLQIDTSHISVPCNSYDDLIYHYDSKTIEQQLLCIENKIPLSYNDEVIPGLHVIAFLN